MALKRVGRISWFYQLDYISERSEATRDILLLTLDHSGLFQ